MNIDDAFRMDALRPPCPTCGGEQVEVIDGRRHPCEDCSDGKVSIEQLVATFNAVHGPGPWDDPMYRDGYCEIGCVNRLRAVKVVPRP